MLQPLCIGDLNCWCPNFPIFYLNPCYTSVLCYLQLLLNAGAYINKCDRNGCTPIYKAAFHGRPALIELLARAGKYSILVYTF